MRLIRRYAESGKNLSGLCQLVSEVLLCLSRDSRAEVDAMVAAALAAGGAEPRAPQDMGFMYGRTFEDLDGHTFEPRWMDVSAMPSSA